MKPRRPRRCTRPAGGLAEQSGGGRTHPVKADRDAEAGGAAHDRGADEVVDASDIIPRTITAAIVDDDGGLATKRVKSTQAFVIDRSRLRRTSLVRLFRTSPEVHRTEDQRDLPPPSPGAASRAAGAADDDPRRDRPPRCPTTPGPLEGAVGPRHPARSSRRRSSASSTRSRTRHPPRRPAERSTWRWAAARCGRAAASTAVLGGYRVGARVAWNAAGRGPGGRARARRAVRPRRAIFDYIDGSSRRAPSRTAPRARRRRRGSGSAGGARWRRRSVRDEVDAADEMRDLAPRAPAGATGARDRAVVAALSDDLDATASAPDGRRDEGLDEDDARLAWIPRPDGPGRARRSSALDGRAAAWSARPWRSTRGGEPRPRARAGARPGDRRRVGDGTFAVVDEHLLALLLRATTASLRADLATAPCAPLEGRPARARRLRAARCRA